MRHHRTVTIVVLTAAISGLSYLVLGAYVRSASDEYVRRAALLAQKGESASARDALTWLLWFEPRHPAALHLTGLSYLQQQNLPAAIQHLERVGEDSAFHAEAHINLATALLADRQLPRAETVLSSHLQRYPKSLIACRQLSGLLLTELRRREAIQILEDYLRLAESDPLAPSDLLLMLRDLATAEFHPPLAETCRSTLEEALKRDPNQPGLQLAMGKCYWEVGNTNAAKPLLQEALRQRPQDRETRLVLCEFVIEQGDLDRAEAVLLGPTESASNPAGSDASALERDDRFWELRCRIAERRGDYDRALNDLARALSLRPRDKEYEARRARLLQRVHRAEDARDAYQRSHELSRSELDLWDLSRDLGVRVPTTTECEHVAQLYESLGRTLQAAAWRRLGEQFKSKYTAPGRE